MTGINKESGEQSFSCEWIGVTLPTNKTAAGTPAMSFTPLLCKTFCLVVQLYSTSQTFGRTTWKQVRNIGRKICDECCVPINYSSGKNNLKLQSLHWTNSINVDSNHQAIKHTLFKNKRPHDKQINEQTNEWLGSRFSDILIFKCSKFADTLTPIIWKWAEPN